jgi:dTDP-4-dehydrorhamnose 3,5-epimerase
MHYQAEPHAEDKLVRCTAGAIYDVIVDLRPNSPTLRRWFGVELSAANHRSLFVPKGLAHGFITLSDDTEVLYMISVPYVPGFERGRALERSGHRHLVADGALGRGGARRGLSAARGLKAWRGHGFW